MKNPRILIVEDDAILATHLEKIIVAFGYESAGLAATGERAIELARREKPDAIVMDIRLRGNMTGIDVAEEIRKKATTPIIYLTAYTDEALLQKAKATEAYAYLAKPVRERELRASLEMALYKHASERRVEHLNLVLRSVRDINQLITHASDPAQLLQDACEILVNTRGYQLVWIGNPHTEGKIILPVARAGAGIDYLDKTRFTWDDSETSKGPTGKAVIRQKPFAAKDLATYPDYEPWRAQALARGFVSSAAFPMLHADRLFGVMSLYADNCEVFGDEEQSLLQEVANDIAFGLMTIEVEHVRRRAQKALYEEKERLSVTLRSIGDGVITTDIEGKIITMNNAAERITGWSQELAAGLPLHSVFHIINELTRSPYPDLVKKAIGEGASAELDIHALLVSRGGTERAVSDSCSAIRDEAGITIGAVIVFSDITEKRKLIESAQRSQKLESLGILAGGIAHDFNNLLGGLYGILEVARMTSHDERVNKHLETMRNTIERARGLTGQLLTFSKGGMPNRKTGKLFPLVSDTVKFALSGSNVASSFRIADDLWLCDFDSNQIGQVFDNITINAAQAMPEGGRLDLEATNVTLTGSTDGDLPAGRYVKIKIRDTGTGIPPNVLPHIFDPFFTTKQNGNGLGLAIAYSTVTKHGGTINVESEPGKGTEFKVLLPASGNQSLIDPETAGLPVAGSGRILVMDDNVDVRATFKVMLESLGYSVVCAGEGNEAIRIFSEESLAGTKFHAIILDLTVHGGMGGREAAGEIRKIDTRVPIVVASGYSEDPVLTAPGEFGFAGSISKPFTLAELSQKLSFPKAG
jgi:PAS domain S-box-containing protein